jgi:hypothetical protein
MDFLNHWLLTILIFLPTAGALLTLVVKGREVCRWTAMVTTIVTFALSLCSSPALTGTRPAPGRDRRGGGRARVYDYHPATATRACADGAARPVDHSFNIDYLVGIDGLSFPWSSSAHSSACFPASRRGTSRR